MKLDKSRALKALLCIVLGATIVPIFLSIKLPDVKVTAQSDGLAGISISSTSIIPFVIAASFTRITDDDKNLIMGNRTDTTSTRESIFALIQENPGIHFRDICRQLKKEIGVVQYHVYILQKFGYITSIKDGRYTRYFMKTQQLDDSARTIISAWQRPVEREIIAALLDDGSPAVGIKGIAARCGVTTQAVNWHVNRLKASGILSSSQEPLPVLDPAIQAKAKSLITSGMITVAD